MSDSTDIATPSALWSGGSYAVAPADLWAGGAGPARVATASGLAWQAAGGAPVGIDVSARLAKAMGRGDDLAAVLDRLATPLGRRSLQVRDGLSGEVLLPDRSALASVLVSDDAGLQRDAVTAYNEWIAAFAAADPSRFVGVGQIPTSGLDDALDALRQCQRLGLKAVALAQPPAGAGTAPGGDAEEFWELAGGQTLVCLVPGFGNPVDAKARNPYGPDEPAVTAGRAPAVSGFLTRLTFAGIPDNVPGLRLLLANAGAGWFPYVMEAADTNYQRAAASRRVALGDGNALPSEYVRRFTWTTFHEDRFAVLHRGFFGEAHLVWSAEAPGAGSDWPDDVEQSARITAGLPESARANLLHDNTCRLFGVAGASFTSADIDGFERSTLFS